MPAAAGQIPPRFDLPRALRRRWWIRRIVFTILVLLGLGVVLDHLGVFGWRGDDWTQYDHKRLTVAHVIDGQSLALRDGAGRETTVLLVGVAAPRETEYWAEESTRYLDERTQGKSVIVRLEGTQTRDAAGRLRAYLYLSDSDNLNADIVRDGEAYADRRVKHSLEAVLSAGEYDARKHGRGLWANIKEEQMPQWRREWLKQTHATRSTSAGG